MIGPLNSSVMLTALRTFESNRAALNQSLERLATGQRINRGSDDPAGLITSENLRAVLAALEAETRTMERADHVIATADAALGGASDMLIEAEALVVANAGGFLSDEEMAANQMQIDSIVASVNRIAGTTSFNGQSLLDGSATITAGGASVTIESIAMGPIGEGEDALAALSAARTQIGTTRAELGAMSRYTIQSGLSSMGVAMENIAAAESAIRDTDYGLETANLMRLQILDFASLSALRISSESAARILDLLG